MKFNLVSEEDIDRLSKLPGVLTEKSYEPPEHDAKVESLRSFYIEKVKPSPRDENSKIILGKIEKAISTPENLFIGDLQNENGYEISIHPVGTLFYKALVWFFDSVSPEKRVWVGSVQVAGEYLRGYFAGIVAYRATKPVRMFRMNNNNMKKLYEDESTPNHIKQLIEDIFGIGISLEDRIRKKSPPTWIVQSVDCTEHAEISNYGALDKSKFRNTQHTLIEYIEQQFNCNSTILPPLVGPILGCMAEEITILTSDIEIDRDNEYSWMNWGLHDVDSVKHFKINEKYNNMNFKLVRWLKEHSTPTTTQCDVLSINVHMFVPVVEADMKAEFIKYIKTINPKILAVQEIPKHDVGEIARACGYKYHWSVNNGSYNDSMKLAVYSRYPAKVKIIEKNYDKKRGMIVLRIGARKLLFTHGPIGKSYMRGRKLDYLEVFYEKYYKNKKLQDTYVDDLLKIEPDLIIGDLNILPQNDQSHKFEELGYKTYDIDTPTSIHDVKVDWVWTKLDGTQRIYNWIYSDHRPIGFDFSDNIERSGGNEPPSISLYRIIITIVLVVIMIIVVLFSATTLLAPNAPNLEKSARMISFIGFAKKQ